MRRKALNRVVVFWRARECLLILILTVGLAPLTPRRSRRGRFTASCSSRDRLDDFKDSLTVGCRNPFQRGVVA